ncbi:MAG: hypothetical protein PHV60_02545 [bacterium]|nr:hypothetical protein [bacterium]
MSSTVDFGTIFSSLPGELRVHLEKSYNKIKTNFIQGKYEPSELNGGKFCEVVIRVLQWNTSSSKIYQPFKDKIRDFGQLTRSFESLSGFPDSIRFHIPKILNALYTIRNKRNIGHINGDVDPNHMDACFIVAAADWVMSELIRILHNVTTIQAQAIVEGLITKKIPVVWNINGKKRVLDPSLKYPDQTLLLLYESYPVPIGVGDLCKWLEYANPSEYRKYILKVLHGKKLIDYDKKTGAVNLSPLGLSYVEKNIRLTI